MVLVSSPDGFSCVGSGDCTRGTLRSVLARTDSSNGSHKSVTRFGSGGNPFSPPLSGVLPVSVHRPCFLRNRRKGR